MKNGVETLAKMFKDRENATSDFVVFGKIIELPNLKIQFTSKIILTKDHIKSLIDLYNQDIFTVSNEFFCLKFARKCNIFKFQIL